MFCFCNITLAQTKGLKVKATVVDQQGNPISNVSIYAANGDKVSSRVNGTFEILSTDDESLVLEKSGYVTKLVNFEDLTGNIVLEKTQFLASKEDEIKMGVTTKNRRNFVGAFSSINTKDRLTYDNTQWVRNYINGLMLGVRGSDNIRGIGSAIFVIDGVIGRDPNILNMELL